MSRSSPAVQRVVAILNFFADHPGQAFTLTDLIKALKLSRATCHAFLTGLVDVGYLYRTSDKSYVLGPALASIGKSASMHYSPQQVAQPEMRALADEFDAICMAIYRDGADAVVRERAASVSLLGWSSQQRNRLPLRPPAGGIFFAWGAPAETEAWLNRFDPPPTAQQRTGMFESMAFAREHGFMFGIRNISAPAPDSAGDWIFVEEHSARPVHVMTSIEADLEYPLSYIQAPVFEANGRVAFVLNLTGFTGRHTGAQVITIGKRLREACNRVTAFTAPFKPAAN